MGLISTAAEDHAFEERSRYTQSVAYANGIGSSVWELDEPADFQLAHPYEGVTHIRYRQFTVPIGGPKWIDLWIATDKAIELTHDLDHRFIEDFDVHFERGLLQVHVGS